MNELEIGNAVVGIPNHEKCVRMFIRYGYSVEFDPRPRNNRNSLVFLLPFPTGQNRMLKTKDMDQLRELLLVLQARLRGDVQTLTSSALGSQADSKSPTHMAELGTETYEQDFSLRVMESDQEVLKEIKVALKKIEEGTYGICEGCVDQGKPPSKCWIPKTRLKVIPHARYCVNCAEKLEKQFSY